MSTMAVVTQAKSAAAVIRWAARFAKIRNDALTVLCCEFGQQVMPATPVDLQQLVVCDEVVQITAEAINEIADIEIQLFRLQQPKPARALV